MIDKILDRKTVEPLHGFTDEELLSQVAQQNDIMDNHEDYAALRAAETSSKKKLHQLQLNQLANFGVSSGDSSNGTLHGSGSGSGSGKIKDKKQIAAGAKGISKIATAETIIYPPMGSLALAAEYLPMSIFKNTDIVEYNSAGKMTLIMHGQ